jgi:hypothetical protein
MGVSKMNALRKVALATIVAVTASPFAVAADPVATISEPVKPGVYGRLAMVSKATPALVYEQPMFIEPPAVAGKIEPVYLHVPPEHAKNWKKYCSKYKACDHPVFFVKSAEYEPGYKEQAEKAAKAEKAAEPGKAKRKFRSGW